MFAFKSKIKGDGLDYHIMPDGTKMKGKTHGGGVFKYFDRTKKIKDNDLEEISKFMLDIFQDD